MPLESGTYVSDLVDTNPAATDNKSQGDDHIRLIKSVLDNTFPNADRAIRLQARRVSEVSATATIALTDEGATVLTTASADITLTLPASAPDNWLVAIKYANSDGDVTVSAPSGETITTTGISDTSVDTGSVVLSYLYDEAVFIKTGASTWGIEQSAVLGILERPWQPSGSRLLSQIKLSTADPVAADLPDGTLYLKYSTV